MASRDPSTNGGNPGNEPVADKAQDLLLDCIERLNAGENVDLERIVEEHADVGEEVVRQLQAFVGEEEQVELRLPLRTLGDYTLGRQLGRGGMGVVYEARQKSLDRQVALKVLPPGIAADTKNFTRFMREARTAARLNHPHVVHVHSVGLEDDTPYYAMEYVEGETLAQLLKRLHGAAAKAATPFGPKDTAACFSRIADAFADVTGGLQHGHSRGVVHRDIKPSNLILDADGRLRILDFGLARIEGQESLTLTGDFIGTPAYMSPEQAKRRKTPVDHRTDIYSLGVTLYELLTHRQPFRGKDQQDTISNIIERSPRPPRQLNSHIPADLETIVLKCLRKDAADRYGTAEALEQDLRRFVRGDSIEARPESVADRISRGLWRYRIPLGIATVFLVLGALGAAVSAVLIAQQRDLAQEERDIARWNAYVASVQAAKLNWDMGNIQSMEQFLESQREPGQAELRHWEWDHLWGLLQTKELTINAYPEGVSWLRWSPDGRFLASQGALQQRTGQEFNVWDPATGEKLASVKPFEFGRLEAAWRYLATATDGVVTVYDLQNITQPRPVQTLPQDGQSLSFHWLAFHPNPDSKRLGTAVGEDGVKVWDLATGDEIFHGKLGHPWGPSFNFGNLLWSPDGRWLAAHNTSGHYSESRHPTIVKVWDVDRDEVALEWEPPEGAGGVGGIAWRPDPDALDADPNGQRLLAVTSKRRFLWVAGSWEQERTGLERWPPWDKPERLFWSRDGLSLAYPAGGGGAPSISVHDMTGDLAVRSLRGHTSGIRWLDWSDAGELASASVDGTVRIWDGTTGETRAVLRGHRGAVNTVAWSPHGTRLASGSSDGTIKIWDARTAQQPFLLPGHQFVQFSPDGKYLAARRVGLANAVVYDTATLEEVVRLKDDMKKSCASLAWHPQGKLAAGAGAPGVVFVWDVATAMLRHRFKAHEKDVFRVEWRPDGRHLASGAKDGKVRIWEAADWGQGPVRLVRVLDHGSGVRTLAWKPTGDGRLASWSKRALKLWDADSGKELFVREFDPRLQGPRLDRLAWSHAGDRLAVGGARGNVIILDGTSGETLEEYRGHISDVVTVAWSRDDRRLASGGSENRIIIWDTETGAELLSFQAPVTALDWSSDSVRLAAVGRGGVRVWEAAVEEIEGSED